MKPPPIGEALTAGWKAFKVNLGANIVGFLCAWLVGLIPFVGGFLALAGFFNVGLKAIRGQKPEPKDGFCAFDAPVDHIVMGLLQICGLIACCIGIWITQPLFLMGTPMIVDKKMKWNQAKDVCMQQVKPNFIAWFIFVLVVGLCTAVGLIAAAILQVILSFIDLGSVGCVLSAVVMLAGLAVTVVAAPIGLCAMAYAYEKNASGLSAPPPPAPAPAA